jgi:hypothetical protein
VVQEKRTKRLSKNKRKKELVMGLGLVCLSIICYTCIVYCILLIFMVMSIVPCETLTSLQNMGTNLVVTLFDNLTPTCLINWTGRVYQVSEKEARLANSRAGLSRFAAQFSFLLSKLQPNQTTLVVADGKQSEPVNVTFTDQLHAAINALELNGTSLVVCTRSSQELQCSWRLLSSNQPAQLENVNGLLLRKTPWLTHVGEALASGLPWYDAISKATQREDPVKTAPGALRLRHGFEFLDGIKTHHVLVSKEPFVVSGPRSGFSKSKLILSSLLWQKQTFS